MAASSDVHGPIASSRAALIAALDEPNVARVAARAAWPGIEEEIGAVLADPARLSALPYAQAMVVLAALEIDALEGVVSAADVRSQQVHAQRWLERRVQQGDSTSRDLARGAEVALAQHLERCNESWTDADRQLDDQEQAVADAVVAALYGGGVGMSDEELAAVLYVANEDVSGPGFLPRSWLAGRDPLSVRAVESLEGMGCRTADAVWCLSTLGLDAEVAPWLRARLSRGEGLRGTLDLLLADRVLSEAECAEIAERGWAREATRAVAGQAGEGDMLLVGLESPALRRAVVDAIASTTWARIEDPDAGAVLYTALGDTAGAHLVGRALRGWLVAVDETVAATWLAIRNELMMRSALGNDPLEATVGDRVSLHLPGMVSQQLSSGVTPVLRDALGVCLTRTLGADEEAWAIFWALGSNHPGTLAELLTVIAGCRQPVVREAAGGDGATS